MSQRRGVISLLLKKGDRTQLNGRPITLLTTDYTILSKALANRLHEVLPLIIHSDQTGSIRWRKINDNARLLYDVISYANTNSVPLAVVSIDQMKAFDRVSHDSSVSSALALALPLSSGSRFSILRYQVRSELTAG